MRRCQQLLSSCTTGSSTFRSSRTLLASSVAYRQHCKLQCHDTQCLFFSFFFNVCQISLFCVGFFPCLKYWILPSHLLLTTYILNYGEKQHWLVLCVLTLLKINNTILYILWIYIKKGFIAINLHIHGSIKYYWKHWACNSTAAFYQIFFIKINR